MKGSGIIIRNKWTGDHFENDIRCEVCDFEASVISICGHLVCGACLNRRSQALSREILKRASFEPRLDSDDDGEFEP